MRYAAVASFLLLFLCIPRFGKVDPAHSSSLTAPYWFSIEVFATPINSPLPHWFACYLGYKITKSNAHTYH